MFGESMKVMRGFIMVRNDDTKEYRTAEGVFTRNFVRSFLRILNVVANTGESATLVDNTNTNRSVIVRVALSSYYAYITNYYDQIGFTTQTPRGLTAKLTASDYTPTPYDYRLPTEDVSLDITSKNIFEESDRITLSFTGSTTVFNDIVIKGVGIYNKIFTWQASNSSFTPVIFETLLDGFSITPISFRKGEGVSVQYSFVFM